MSDLDFFADLVITGTVLGLDHTSRLDEVEEVLGRDCTFEAPSGVISDFGLVEFGWLRDRPQDDWSVVYFGAQAHRLPDLTREDMPAALLGRYGGFRSRLYVGELRGAVEARGFTLEERPGRGGRRPDHRACEGPRAGHRRWAADDGRRRGAVAGGDDRLRQRRAAVHGAATDPR
ncbi:hypothetical protein [Microbispora siamensis]|uniref:hypothetical protein n=1 Tax=Microbispora siamensis TaxID=564413 RepID=UPI001951E20B|nr:hypothetical protein [Microbispora siamensis]